MWPLLDVLPVLSLHPGLSHSQGRTLFVLSVSRPRWSQSSVCSTSLLTTMSLGHPGLEKQHTIDALAVGQTW